MLDEILPRSSSLAAATASGDGVTLLLDLLLLLVLILVNAFFAASEIAIISLNDSRVRKLAEDGDRTALRLQSLLSEPSRFLATIQVGITFAGFLASAFAAEKFAGRLSAWIDPAGRLPILHTLSMVIITILLSYVSLVLGELLPKRLALQNPEKVSRFVVGIILATGVVLSPFVHLLTGSTNLLLRILGIDPTQKERTVTEEEIRMMVDVGRETGTIHAQEKEMIENIFEFNDKAVSEIMTHRTDIVSLPVDATFEEVMETVLREQFTRIPVYGESIDDILGILHTKDLLKHVFSRPGVEKPFRLRDLLRDPYEIPDSKPVDVLLREMQRDRVQMAVVIDEYGGTAGIVTVEDLLEEIVGSIQDEYDEEEQELVLLEDGSYLAEGRTPLEDVADALGVPLPEEDYDTIGGFMASLLGRIPDEDETPEARWKNLVLRVVNMDDRRIAKVGIVVEPEVPEEAEAEPENGKPSDPRGRSQERNGEGDREDE